MASSLPAPILIMPDNNPQEPIFGRSRRSYIYESGHRPKNPVNKRAILIGSGIAILVLLVIFSVFASSNNNKEENISPTPAIEVPTATPIESVPTEAVTPTITEAPTPTAKVTPSPTVKASVTPGTSSSVDKATGLDRSNLTIEIQNGGGVAGAATKASTFLKGLGYNISTTGNADNFEYTNTEIQIKSTKKAYLELLKKDLSSNYTVGDTSTTLADSTADAIVIVGKN